MGAPAEGGIDESSTGDQQDAAEDTAATETRGAEAPSSEGDHPSGSGSGPDPDQQ